MEVVQIVEDMPQEWDGVILSDEHGNQFTQDYITLENTSEMLVNQPQLYFLDANNRIVPVESMANLAFFADVESDDGEVPSHILDHMYSKKPREPGTELTKPVRRRSKKKEQSISQVFVEELIPETPKINIIRQRLPMAQSPFKSAPTRPKILQGSHSSTNPGSHDTNYLINNPTSSLLAMATTLKASPSTLEYHLNLQSDTSNASNRQRTVYDDCEIPQIGEMVTITDVGKGAMRGRKSKTMPNTINTSVTDTFRVVSNVQNYNEEQKISIALLDDEKVEVETVVPEELFFDMIEEPDGLFTVGMDVDMDDIELGNSNIVVTSAAGRSTVEFEEIDQQTASKQARKRRQPTLQQCATVSNSLLMQEGKLDEPSSNIDKSQQKDPNLMQNTKKHVSWKMDSEADSGSDKQIIILPYESSELEEKVFTEPNLTEEMPVNLKSVPTPTRRSTRPIKLPARLEDLEDVALKRRRR